MLKHSYPDYTEHWSKHQKMLSNVKTLKKDYKQGKKDLSHKSTNISEQLAYKHIAGTDKRYSSFMNNIGVN